MHIIDRWALSAGSMWLAKILHKVGQVTTVTIWLQTRLDVRLPGMQIGPAHALQNIWCQRQSSTFPDPAIVEQRTLFLHAEFESLIRFIVVGLHVRVRTLESLEKFLRTGHLETQSAVTDPTIYAKLGYALPISRGHYAIYNGIQDLVLEVIRYL